MNNNEVRTSFGHSFFLSCELRGHVLRTFTFFICALFSLLFISKMIKIKKYIKAERDPIEGKNMKIKAETGRYDGYIILSGSELGKWNLKFLVYYDGKEVTFCATDFLVEKMVEYDNMYVKLSIIRSAWNLSELEREIHYRAPNLLMDDDEFFRAHKSYKKELTKIENESYFVGEAPDDFMEPQMREYVEKQKSKIKWENKWLSNWERIKGNPTYRKHEKKRDDLQAEVSTLEIVYNRPDETDMWSDCKTTYDDFELYHF